MKIVTPECMHCGQSSTVEIGSASYEAWKGGMLIQRAFPTMTDDQRELLITGTHPQCWDAMFGEGESDTDPGCTECGAAVDEECDADCPEATA